MMERGFKSREYGGFPKIRGTPLGVPIIRIVVFWGYIGVSLFCGFTGLGSSI